MKNEEKAPVEESIVVPEDDIKKRIQDASQKIISVETASKKVNETTAGSRTEKAKVTGAMESAANYVTSLKEKADDAETMISVKVKNPLARITKLLQDIKNHQSTTVSLRFTIPLIALPIVLLAAFQLGRAQTICATRFSTQVGTIKMLTIKAPVENTDSLALLRSFFPDFPKLTKQSELQTEKRTILVTSEGLIIQVLHPESINLLSFNNAHVIITGQHSPCTGIITLDAKENIVGE